MITVMDMVTSYVIVVYSNVTTFGTSVLGQSHMILTNKNFLFSTLLISVWLYWVWQSSRVLLRLTAGMVMARTMDQWMKLHPQHKLGLIDTRPNVSIDWRSHKKCPHIKTDTFRILTLVIIGLWLLCTTFLWTGRYLTNGITLQLYLCYITITKDTICSDILNQI